LELLAMVLVAEESKSGFAHRTRPIHYPPVAYTNKTVRVPAFPDVVPWIHPTEAVLGAMFLLP